MLPSTSQNFKTSVRCHLSLAPLPPSTTHISNTVLTYLFSLKDCKPPSAVDK